MHPMIFGVLKRYASIVPKPLGKKSRWGTVGVIGVDETASNYFRVEGNVGIIAFNNTIPVVAQCDT